MKTAMEKFIAELDFRIRSLAQHEDTTKSWRNLTRESAAVLLELRYLRWFIYKEQGADVGKPPLSFVTGYKERS